MKYIKSFKIEMSLKKGLVTHYCTDFVIRLAFILYIGLVELPSEAGPVDKGVFTTALVILAISEVAILLFLFGIWKSIASLFWPFIICNSVVIIYAVATVIYCFVVPDRSSIGIAVAFFVVLEPYFIYGTVSYYVKVRAGVAGIGGGAPGKVVDGRTHSVA